MGFFARLEYALTGQHTVLLPDENGQEKQYSVPCDPDDTRSVTVAGTVLFSTPKGVEMKEKKQ
jgi:hypothetical protein